MLSLGSNSVVIERHPSNGAVSPKRPRPSGIQKTPVLSTAELAECNCPEFCERDHDLD
jgi:hypothetical protein